MTLGTLEAFLALAIPLFQSLEAEGVAALTAQINKISNPIEKQAFLDLLGVLDTFAKMEIAKA